MNTIVTRQQRMAQAAFLAVNGRQGSNEYKSFAKSFPSLIHTAGLCQAVAFAQARRAGSASQVLEDVFQVYSVSAGVQVVGLDAFAESVRLAPVTEYLRLSRLALQAATWVKRYVEALG